MKQLIEDVALIAYAAVLILLMAALYWSCRVFGVDLNDDF